MKAVTLKARIIILLTIFSVIIIGVFVAVQLQHQLAMVRKYQNYEAQTIFFALKNSWKNVSSFPIGQEEKLKFLKEKISSLGQLGSVKQASLFDRDGRLIFSSQKDLPRKTGSTDLGIIRNIKQKNLNRKITIDKEKQTFSLFMPLPEEGSLKYTVKIIFSLEGLGLAFRQVYRPAFMMGVFLVLVNIGLGVFLSRLVIGPVKVFNEAAKKISGGRLDLKINISTQDELEELSGTFNDMTSKLAKMKKKAENANPLTKLPGNIVIMEKVEKRIKRNDKFMLIYCDLDNFKAFNDKYGIHKGDEAIELTGRIFKEAIQEKGKPQDFIGHEGGDDFLILTVSERAKTIAEKIISDFDRQIRKLYDDDDLERDYIIAHARDGSINKFPIMTISLAGVTNQHRLIKNYGQVTNIAAEVKKKAKSQEVSCFVVDRRKK